jgi:hypothetical protein
MRIGAAYETDAGQKCGEKTLRLAAEQRISFEFS